MRRARRLATALLVAWAAPAAAVSLTLSERETSEAVRVGRQSVSAEAFDAEWRVANGSGETATVLTPFHRVALAARHAAFKQETLRPAELRKLQKEQQGRLVVWVALRGKSDDFARFYAPLLRLGDREIAPAFVQNERTAAREEGGAFLARCVYGFPIKDLKSTSRVQLVVRNADGRDVSRFTIDLSKMR